MKFIFKIFTFATKENKEAKRVLKSLDLCLAIFDIQNKIRRMEKDDNLNFEILVDAINEILEHHSIDINDLIE